MIEKLTLNPRGALLESTISHCRTHWDFNIGLIVWERSQVSLGKVGLWHGIFYIFSECRVKIIPHALQDIKILLEPLLDMEMSYIPPNSYFENSILREPWWFQTCSCSISDMHCICQRDCQGIWPIMNVIQGKWEVPEERDQKKKMSYWAGGWEKFVQVYSQEIESEMLESSASWVFFMSPSVGMLTKTRADQSAAPINMWDWHLILICAPSNSYCPKQ